MTLCTPQQYATDEDNQLFSLGVTAESPSHVQHCQVNGQYFKTCIMLVPSRVVSVCVLTFDPDVR